MSQIKKILPPLHLIISTLILVLFATSTCTAQGVEQLHINKLSKVYQQRELKASTTLQSTLSQQRRFIAEKKLTFLVANTSVSELKLETITGAKMATPRNPKRSKRP